MEINQGGLDSCATIANQFRKIQDRGAEEDYILQLLSEYIYIKIATVELGGSILPTCYHGEKAEGKGIVCFLRLAC